MTRNRILTHLQRTSEGTVRDIAEAVGKTTDAVRNSIRRLVASGEVVKLDDKGCGARFSLAGRPAGTYALFRRVGDGVEPVFL